MHLQDPCPWCFRTNLRLGWKGVFLVELTGVGIWHGDLNSSAPKSVCIHPSDFPGFSKDSPQLLPPWPLWGQQSCDMNILFHHPSLPGCWQTKKMFSFYKGDRWQRKVFREDERFEFQWRTGWGGSLGKGMEWIKCSFPWHSSNDEGAGNLCPQGQNRSLCSARPPSSCDDWSACFGGMRNVACIVKRV